MGLMSWLRGGGRTETSAGTGAGGAGYAPAAAPRERVDPAELPPIQRMLGGQDLVIDPSGFQGSLATRQDTSLGTPLGHLVSPDAPTGLVHGITAPAPAESPSPVQRSAERPGEVSVRTGYVPLPRPMPVQRAAASGAPAMTSAGESAVAGLPVRQLVGEQPLVAASAPEPAAEASSGPAVQRSALPSSPDRPRRAPGLGAPMSALPPTAQRQAAHAAPEAEAAAGSYEAAAAPEASEVREAPEAPSASSGVPEPAPDTSGATAPLLGDSPLLPAASEPVPAAPAPAVQRSSAVSFPGPLAPPRTSDPVAPLLADRPVALQAGPGGGVGAVQSSAVDGAEAETAGVPSAGTGAMPGPSSYSPPSASPSAPPDSVPVRWTSDRAGVPSVTPAASLPAALQRTATATAPAPGEAARTSYPSRPALQRQAVGGPPVPRSLPGSGSRSAPAAASAPSVTSTSFTTAGSAAVAAGVAQRMADGSVVFGSPPPSYSAAVVQRETESEEPPPPDPPQDAAPEPEPEPEPGPTAEAHGAPGASGAAPAHGGAPVVSDELVRALYAPLSRLFKADLRLERERAGFLINTRH
ncbi:hypothetical protein OG887_21440 [Streptomyces sp. NBC_00053]|uniref:hypothetical protein n=1 Tax=unclassified Streptomyces TaxID=2593676 RepID=UPI00225B7C1B|nr:MULTISPECIES: hypothetical protein [unclassified Streptomyces]MCX5501922.1 hypothetical protein [Streptomyces sp. NBC_00052]MCX5549542.1 hypothetical protein [Streptomyces sp. NBC_00051]